ncbi:MAG: DUF3108 domain-containing protein [Acidobacteria bacterium]|nr:DUF3108 domain-containing protein [Acidobacteriota bacterium]MBU4307756.1 DUF3108 domain-containing protein [Acidobacteriota bacterium]MBU4404001.1 DUF3108 domain-containing protein [Acidobacteriota bacterium]MCG2812766.1 DUF3108 domain-containing protein [Candidatus Aminicenantes bacterium]
MERTNESRVRLRTYSVLWLLVLGALSSFAVAAGKPVPFRSGERITLTISWSDQVSAATMTLDVGQKQTLSGVPCYLLRAELKPSALIGKLYPVYYKIESLLAEASLLPQKSSMYSREKSRVRQKFTHFDRKAGHIHYTYLTKTEQKKVFPAASGVLDILSWLYVLRTLPLQAGTIGPFQITENGKLFTMRCQVTRSAAVNTELGKLPVWRLAPRVESAGGEKVPRNMFLWISGDERRLPLRFEVELPVGKFVAMMSGYSR